MEDAGCSSLPTMACETSERGSSTSGSLEVQIASASESCSAPLPGSFSTAGALSVPVQPLCEASSLDTQMVELAGLDSSAAPPGPVNVLSERVRMLFEDGGCTSPGSTMVSARSRVVQLFTGPCTGALD
jgi:hypothetical protein